MNTDQLSQLVIKILDDNKALQIIEIDVTPLTSITDRMIICSATSKRHASALADKVITEAKAHGQMPLGTEGEKDAEWVLIDLHDVIVHVMLPEVREFYGFEKLWRVAEAAHQPHEV